MHCFTGKELSDETSLYDFSARFMHARFGRFTTIDPLAEKYPSVSPYAYCNGNPVNFVDPDGEVPVFVVTALIGAGVSGITAVIEGKSASEVLAATLGGAVDGAIGGLGLLPGVGTLGAIGLGTLGGGAGDFVEQSINLAFGNQSKIEGTEIALSATFGAITGTIDVAGNNLGKHLEDFYSSDETIKSMAKEIKNNSSRRMSNKKATDQAKKIAEEAQKNEVKLVDNSKEAIIYTWDIYYNLQDE
jgi:RHS repeat-associated protein